ncbi:hypothetical protein PR202_ga01573 [Eleusine coracana subsp. coracana]|uniref:non-specific serine/threonine protein kinase n=1 Tax=Eleusine coracana subsp. coracana TaxID=191504 RepID=A0AAV5BHL8_ELECO|nr:hypothetical protein PR202_ga00886 [Eleusine coracana subsp. coracana]GJM85776.1 hypothetical protein PR202_ga01573 [Eleusine coracana subsp. coracana]
MEEGPGRSRLALALCVAAAALMASLAAAAGDGGAVAQELRRGFSATHDPSYSQFQPVLGDPTGAFALGFLRVDNTSLDLAVLHLPSSFPLWRAIPDRPVSWSAAATLSFDDAGGLVLTDPAANNKVLWSTSGGDRAVLLNTSNLQIQSSSSKGGSVAWQSFDHPSETIVQGQNFTSDASLHSSDRRFSMRIANPKFFALYIEPPPSASRGAAAAAMYWRHTAMEAKAQIVEGGGPTYARVEPDGFLAMYQREGPPADVLSFDTFNRGVRAFRRVTLETDGNLRAYYWADARWALDYTAITEPCELPTTCGTYGVCFQPNARCECLANATDGGCGRRGRRERRAVRRRGRRGGGRAVPGRAEAGRGARQQGADRVRARGVGSGLRGAVRPQLQLLGRRVQQRHGQLLPHGLPGAGAGGQRRQEAGLLQGQDPG